MLKKEGETGKGIEMILLIIRHGESEADLLDVHEGRADFCLTERGHKQAEAMSKYVKRNYNLTRIYSSTLRRATETARHLSMMTQVPITYDEDLMEFNNGLLAGLSREEADRLYPEVKDLPIDKAVYGQESQVCFRERAERVLNKIISENDQDAVVAIVSHGGMINQLYGAFVHTEVSREGFFCTGDTGIHVWKVTERGRYVLKANVGAHTKGI